MHVETMRQKSFSPYEQAISTTALSSGGFKERMYNILTVNSNKQQNTINQPITIRLEANRKYSPYLANSKSNLMSLPLINTQEPIQRQNKTCQ